MSKILFSFCFLFFSSNLRAQEFGDRSVFRERVFETLEKAAQFPGGTKALYQYISENLNVPKGKGYKTLNHYVVLELIIDPSGKIVYGKVQKGMGGDFDKAAIELVQKMPNWEPGRQNGRVAYSYVFLPIMFME